MKRAGTGSLALASVVLIVLAWVLLPLLSRSREAGAPETEAAASPPPPPTVTVSDTLGRGETLAQLLGRHGFDAASVYRVTQAIRKYRKPRSLRPGVVMEFSAPPGAPPDRLTLQLDRDSILHLAASDGGWAARLEEVPVTVDTVRLAGVIETNLWSANLSGDIDRLEPGGFDETVYNLADVFAWKVDFTRDIRVGDRFRVALQREVRPDGSVRSRRFLAIELINQGHVMRAIPFQRPGGKREYFDPQGKALRGVFLRYPVPYRITSRFSMHRYHPILKRYRPHQGIDYGAPYGTKVHATASGTITRAGRWGGYGNIVEIRHTHGIRTRYAHLSSFAPGIRPGKHVNQGQFIGRVGATGLATGTHLHYEFLKNGVHKNPLSVKLPTAPALEKKYMTSFRAKRDSALALLDGIEASAPMVAQATGSDPR